MWLQSWAVRTRNPTFLAVAADGKFLFAVSKVNGVGGKPTGAVSACALDTTTGKLTPLNEQSSGGRVCALFVGSN